ncbi:MAG TPA: zf-HC2 domain-containing protein, partial [Candidatus Acidoferrum sp.]|nr:zf-HC2 domain-containing protein [Candidatus Acidoferrum sp.]
MSDHVDVWIPELVMGTLDGPTRTTVELHLRTCDRCAAEAVAMGEALSALALSLPPERPSATLRTRVLSSIVEEQQRRDRRFEEGRFHGFVDRLAEFFDVT